MLGLHLFTQRCFISARLSRKSARDLCGGCIIISSRILGSFPTCLRNPLGKATPCPVSPARCQPGYRYRARALPRIRCTFGALFVLLQAPARPPRGNTSPPEPGSPRGAQGGERRVPLRSPVRWADRQAGSGRPCPHPGTARCSRVLCPRRHPVQTPARPSKFRIRKRFRSVVDGVRV